jgi:hypothetical protein
MTRNQHDQDPGQTASDAHVHADTGAEPEPDTPVAQMSNYRQGWDETAIPSPGIVRAIANVDPPPVSDDEITAMIADIHTALQDPPARQE